MFGNNPRSSGKAATFLSRKFALGRLMICILSTAIGLPTLALADEYTVHGCILLLDNMSGSPNSDSGFSAIRHMKIKFDFFDGLASHPTTGFVTTRESGCFDARLFNMPPWTSEVRAKLVLDGDNRKTVNPDGHTYVYTLPWEDVRNDGDVVDYGTFVADDVEENGGVHMWVMSGHAMDFYSERVSEFSDRGYGRLHTRFPIDRNSNYANGSINMEGGGGTGRNARRNRLDRTFMHEFGHWLNDADATTPGIAVGSYCQNFSGISHPLDKSPIAYTEPSACTSADPAGHHDYSWETADRAMSEGFADFTMDFLPDGDCKKTRHMDRPLTFDEDHNETSVRTALCDVLDRDSEEAVWAHVFGPPEQVEPLDGDAITSSSGSNGAHAFGSDGDVIFAIDYSDGLSSALVDVSMVMGHVERLAADGGRVCATDRSTIHCFDLAGNGIAGPLPNVGWIIHDIHIEGGQLYAVVAEMLYDSIYSVPVTGGTWQLVYREPAAASPHDIRSVAVSSAGSELVIGRAHRLEKCSLANCSTTRVDLAGSSSEGGFRRAAPLDSLFLNIKQVILEGTRLWVLDEYGVSRMDGVGDVEQYVGPGPERIMRTNLAPRAMDTPKSSRLDSGDHFFATDGVVALFETPEARVVDTNRKGDYENWRFHIDVSDDETTEIFCGAESVDRPGATIMQAFTGRPLRTVIGDFLSNYLGLSAAEQMAIETTNWIRRNPNCDDLSFRYETVVNWGGSPSTPPSLEADAQQDDDACGGPQEDAGYEETGKEVAFDLVRAAEEAVEGREPPETDDGKPGPISGDAVPVPEPEWGMMVLAGLVLLVRLGRRSSRM